MKIKNLSKVAKRILEIIANKEKIVIYGDADLDGISSVVILKQVFESFDSDYRKKLCRVYFSDRENEGYGATQSLIRFCTRVKPATLFLLDCGISSFKEIETLEKMKIQVIIVDHHKPLDKLPKASIIIDPKQKGDKYSFKELSAAGLAYKLAKETFRIAKQDWQPESYLELAALATLADQMSRLEDNQKIIRDGLLALPYSKRLGLKILMKMTDFHNEDENELFQKIIAPLNSSERVGHLTKSYLVLTGKRQAKVRLLIKDLLKKNLEKKELINKIFSEANSRVDAKHNNEPLIFEADSSWPVISLGVVASRLLQEYKKPVFLFKIVGKESVCSARLPKGVDGVEAMAACKDLLITYGGHPPACGCRLYTKNLNFLKECLIKYFRNQ